MTDFYKQVMAANALLKKRERLDDLAERLMIQGQRKRWILDQEKKRQDLIDRIDKAHALTVQHSKLMDKIYGKRK